MQATIEKDLTAGPPASRENTDVVRAALEAFNQEGVEAALDYLHPEVEWIAPPQWLEDQVYEGHDGVRKVASIWHETFDAYELDLEELIDAGDHVLALVTRRGRIKRSGDPIEQRIAYDWTLRDGRGVRVQAYFSWEEARAALGRPG